MQDVVFRSQQRVAICQRLLCDQLSEFFEEARTFEPMKLILFFVFSCWVHSSSCGLKHNSLFQRHQRAFNPVCSPHLIGLLSVLQHESVHLRVLLFQLLLPGGHLLDFFDKITAFSHISILLLFVSRIRPHSCHFFHDLQFSQPHPEIDFIFASNFVVIILSFNTIESDQELSSIFTQILKIAVLLMYFRWFKQFGSKISILDGHVS